MITLVAGKKSWARCEPSPSVNSGCVVVNAWLGQGYVHGIEVQRTSHGPAGNPSLSPQAQTRPRFKEQLVLSMVRPPIDQGVFRLIKSECGRAKAAELASRQKRSLTPAVQRIARGSKPSPTWKSH